MYTVLLLALTSGAAAPRIAVLDVKPRVGVTKELAQGVTDEVVVEVRRLAHSSSVVGADEIRSMLGFEQQKLKLGCQDTSCLAEIGGALGVDELVLGTISRFGSTYVLSLQLVETRSSHVVKQASSKLQGHDEDALLAVVDRTVEQIFPETPVPAPATEPVASATATPVTAHSPLLRWTFVGVGGVAAIVAAISGGEVLSYVGFNNQLSSQPVAQTTVQSARSRQSTADAFGTAGLVLAGVAVGCAVGAVLTW